MFNYFYFVPNNSRVKEPGGARSTYGGGEVLYADFWCRNLKENDTLQDQVIDGKIILKRTVIKTIEVDWNYVHCHKDNRLASVNTTINRRVA